MEGESHFQVRCLAGLENVVCIFPGVVELVVEERCVFPAPPSFFFNCIHQGCFFPPPKPRYHLYSTTDMYSGKSTEPYWLEFEFWLPAVRSSQHICLTAFGEPQFPHL